MQPVFDSYARLSWNPSTPLRLGLVLRGLREGGDNLFGEAGGVLGPRTGVPEPALGYAAGRERAAESASSTVVADHQARVDEARIER
jgi:hypothetical protein